ncbi:unnamed protein product [Heterobilharzia americana]|nr:unnamed protein product [Heterobilharzia americana]
MRTTVGSECRSGPVVGVNSPTSTSYNSSISRVESRIRIERYPPVIQSSASCSTVPQVANDSSHCSRNTFSDRVNVSHYVPNRPKSVNFSGVTVYSFERRQGFSSIPESGWCTLGMAKKHFTVSRLDLYQYRLLRRLRRRQRRLASKKSRSTSYVSGRGRGRGKIRGRGKRANEPVGQSPGNSFRVPILSPPPPLSPQAIYDKISFAELSDNAIMSTCTAYTTPSPPCLSPPSPRRFVHILGDSVASNNVCNSLDILDTDSEASLDQVPSINSSGRTQNGTREKLMPLHPAARIKLLRSSGVVKIDESERLVCSFVRTMRSRVGCNCGPGDSCVPGQCLCADEEIPCQVDRESFPCSCVANGCCNPNGRHEFSREQVRAHAQHVLARTSQLTSDSPVHSIESQLDTLVTDNVLVLSTPNGACSLCSNTPKPIISSSTPVCYPDGDHSVPVENCKYSSNNCLFSNQRVDSITHVTDYISPIHITSEVNCSPSSQCFKPLRKNRSLASSFNCNTENRVLDNSFNLTLNSTIIQSKDPPLKIDLTLSPAENLRNRSPKCTRDNGRPICVKQTRISKLTNCIHSTDVLHNEFTPQTDVIHTRIEKTPILSLKNTTSNDFLMISFTQNDNINNESSPLRSMNRITERRRSLSADTSETHNCDNFLLETTNSHSKNVDSILDCVHRPTSDLYNVNKCPMNDQVSKVPNAFEYLKSNPRWFVNTLMNNDVNNTNGKNQFISKSAPNSPCIQNTYPFGRISLRRRAIPRLPVTPSRRAITQSNRNQILNSLYCPTPESTPGILNSSSIDHQHTCNNDSVLSPLQSCNNSNLMTESFSQSTEIKIQSPV